jgi:lycopene cyclase domain-containing protein
MANVSACWWCPESSSSTTMPDHLLYLCINVASIAIPLACSFERRIRFYSSYRALFPAVVLPAAVFIIWDSLFTNMAVWGFNPRYLSGIRAGNLPLEEILFFLCIPYACLFTHEVLRYFVKRDLLGVVARPIGMGLLIALLVAAAVYHQRLYTFWTAILTAVFIAVHLFLLRRTYWSRLILTYAVILLPFFIVNGVLTGMGLPEAIVWYDNAENMGIRMLTIPVEDAFYGFLLIGLNITVFEELRPKV